MIQKFRYPKPEELNKLFQRPAIAQDNLDTIIDSVFDRVEEYGDQALRDYTLQFDNAKIDQFLVSKQEFQEAGKLVSKELKAALKLAKENIESFHQAQLQKPEKITTKPGVHCWRIQRPIESVGLYIPGGTAPLFSTVLMLGIPAVIAGCKTIVLCTPPNSEGKIDPAILVTAQLAGISTVYKVGGSQAIAAMTLGTESIPKVLKIFGPGNQYVTAAKMKALKLGTAIDMPAGPSELLVIADNTANPSYVAADLLSQAEHGIDSQVILLATDEAVLDATLKEVENQKNQLPRKAIINEALTHSKAILLEDLEQCIEASNQYAPEHLILATEHPENLLASVVNAGSIFLGKFSCESLGDYASGTNHTLPTNGYAKTYSGVSTDSYLKTISVQQVYAEGIKEIGPAVEIMARQEQLTAHERAVSIRLNDLT